MKTTIDKFKSAPAALKVLIVISLPLVICVFALGFTLKKIFDFYSDLLDEWIW
jgi:hypothetical protein